jgi:hypothetical protein
MLLIMHHITLCTSCIAFLLVSHICAFCDRSPRAGTQNNSYKLLLNQIHGVLSKKSSLTVPLNNLQIYSLPLNSPHL